MSDYAALKKNNSPKTLSILLALLILLELCSVAVLTGRVINYSSDKGSYTISLTNGSNVRKGILREDGRRIPCRKEDCGKDGKQRYEDGPFHSSTQATTLLSNTSTNPELIFTESSFSPVLHLISPFVKEDTSGAWLYRTSKAPAEPGRNTQSTSFFARVFSGESTSKDIFPDPDISA